jgi:hypothetical protein
MTDHTHRDLCSATSGLFNAYLDMSEKETNGLDKETVEVIAQAFVEKHEEFGAETPTPDVE